MSTQLSTPFYILEISHFFSGWFYGTLYYLSSLYFIFWWQYMIFFFFLQVLIFFFVLIFYSLFHTIYCIFFYKLLFCNICLLLCIPYSLVCPFFAHFFPNFFLSLFFFFLVSKKKQFFFLLCFVEFAVEEFIVLYFNILFAMHRQWVGYSNGWFYLFYLYHHQNCLLHSVPLSISLSMDVCMYVCMKIVFLVFCSYLWFLEATWLGFKRITTIMLKMLLLLLLLLCFVCIVKLIYA